MYRFEAIRVVHPQVVTLKGESEALDNNQNPVSLNEELIAVEVARMTQEALEAKAIAEAKEAKGKALDELVITHNTVAYDANGKAIGNMSAVMGVANFKYNQMVAQGTNPATAYDAIYKSTLFWRGADNKAHEVMIESVCEALEKSMLEVSKVLGL